MASAVNPEDSDQSTMVTVASNSSVSENQQRQQHKDEGETSLLLTSGAADDLNENQTGCCSSSSILCAPMCSLSCVVNWIFTTGAILVALYAVFVYGFLTEWAVPLGASVHPLMQAAFVHERATIYIHALTSAVALAIGPFQVIPTWRRGHMLAHRRAGYVFFVCSIVGSASGIAAAQNAQGGERGRIGFTILGSLWLFTSLGGFFSIAVFKKVKIHEHFMQHSCALSYAAVTLRLMLPIAVTGSFAMFENNYGYIAWACWIPNVVVVEILRWYHGYYTSS